MPETLPIVLPAMQRNALCPVNDAITRFVLEFNRHFKEKSVDVAGVA